ncbi:MAG: hypothetical protein RQ885_09560 [Desulfurococcales archaeon]|nr:hypothetical protein [Desulfurococcales archaeon]
MIASQANCKRRCIARIEAFEKQGLRVDPRARRLSRVKPCLM